VDASLLCLGVVGVSADILKLAELVNNAKLKFRNTCTPLSRLQTRVPDQTKSSTRAITALRAILRTLQRSDLNLLAVYRKIPLLTIPPVSIVYSRASTRSVYRKSVEEIHTLLLTAKNAAAASDRARLESLSPHVTHLAHVRGRPRENVRANIVYARLDARGRGRVQIAGELPILYVQSRREPPDVRFPPPTTEPKRVRQPLLEPSPFLESLPVFRYAQP
jgi:hypothetical protein